VFHWLQDCLVILVLLRSPVLRFLIDRPYRAAVRSVRQALEEAGLRTPVELDVAESLREELYANLAPSLVLLVDDPVLLLEAVMFYPGAALYVSQPIVLTARGNGTGVEIRSRESLLDGGLPHSVRTQVLCLHGRVMRVLEKVAVREDAPMGVCAH
jgi:hypothetical protein